MGSNKSANKELLSTERFFGDRIMSQNTNYSAEDKPH